jgi:hypothetical protein
MSAAAQLAPAIMAPDLSPAYDLAAEVLGAPKPKADDVDAALAAVRSEIAEREAAAERASQASVTAPSFAMARQHKAEAADLKLVNERLAAMDVQLVALAAKLADERDEAARVKRRRAAIAERDALSEWLKDRYPAIVAELVEAAARIRINNEAIADANRECRPGEEWQSGAETVGRGCKVNAPGSPMLAGGNGLRLPAPRDCGYPAWPPQPMVETAAALAVDNPDIAEIYKRFGLR